jgi:hypothetical protein
MCALLPKFAAMPSAAPDRIPLHTRTTTFNGFARPDGLWDMEGELHDTKQYSYPSHRGEVPAGTPIHHLFLRVTVDGEFCIQAIESSMQNTPFGECKVADASLQQMVGKRMGPGWRQTIERNIGGTLGCTHLRELLFNIATAAFQTIPHHQQLQRVAKGEPKQADSEPPFYMGKCMTWDFNGSVVARVAPKFIGWNKPSGK